MHRRSRNTLIPMCNTTTQMMTTVVFWRLCLSELPLYMYFSWSFMHIIIWKNHQPRRLKKRSSQQSTNTPLSPMISNYIKASMTKEEASTEDSITTNPSKTARNKVDSQIRVRRKMLNNSSKDKDQRNHHILEQRTQNHSFQIYISRTWRSMLDRITTTRTATIHLLT